MLNRKIKGPVLPIELFYTSWKDGGLSLTNLEQRYSFVRLRTSHIFSTVNSEAGTEITWNVSESERISE
jgi:hypothetical protein